MRAWESAEWFAKWLELARIEMEAEVAEDPLLTHAVSNADATSPLGGVQLRAVEEHALAA